MLITLFATTLMAVAPQEAAKLGGGKVDVSDIHMLRVTAVRADGPVRVFSATDDRDSDNDGIPDSYEIHVTCRGGAVASSVIGAGQVSAITGGAMAARAKGGIMAADDWQTHAVGKVIQAKYDLKTMKGARAAATAPMPVALTDAASVVCAR